MPELKSETPKTPDEARRLTRETIERARRENMHRLSLDIPRALSQAVAAEARALQWTCHIGSAPGNDPAALDRLTLSPMAGT